MMDQLLDKAPCGYFSFFDDGTVLHVNETLCSVLQYEREQVMHKNVETIFTLSTRIFFQTHFFPLVKMHGHAEEIFLSLLTSNGAHLPVLLNARRSMVEDRSVTACAFIVVPTRKKFEDELVAARKAAESAVRENTDLLKAKEELRSNAEKLEKQMQLVKRQNRELQQFSHAVTHNLKEPLRKMLIYIDKMQTGNTAATMGKLENAAAQMKLVVNSLQQYVWLTEKNNEFTAVDLNIIVQKAAWELQEETGPGLLNLHYQNLPTLEADAEQLKLLLYHLLSNAVKFRKDKTANVTISSVMLKRNTFASVESKYQYEDFIRLEVQDDGIGFDPAYKEYIFDLFKKLNATPGQGLGLALCKKVADNHSGFIEASGKLNAFARITVWLPFKQNQNAEPASRVNNLDHSL